MIQRDIVATPEMAMRDPYRLDVVYYPPRVPAKSRYVLAEGDAPAEEKVAKGWRTASYVLGVAVIAQFFWWDNKCPQVLRGGKGYGR
jgi:hypothetical protein